jgi:hypothetical protein
METYTVDADNPELAVIRDGCLTVDGSIDWLTCTVKSPQMRDRLFAEASVIIEQAKALGEVPQGWPFKGYKGLRIFGFRWGTRHDSDIAMLSGLDARQHWYTFASLAENVSRLDLAVTCELQYPLPNVAGMCYDWVLENLKNPELRKRIYSLVRDTNGGQTLYVGSRASDQFGRLYDKARESQADDLNDRLWRYEVEFKGARAKAVNARLLDRATIPETARAGVAEMMLPACPTPEIIGTVYLWFDSRHVHPLFYRTSRRVATEVEARVTSDEISLLWLARFVRPTVGRLIRNGKVEAVYEALELPNLRQSDEDRRLNKYLSDLRHLTPNKRPS